MRNPHKVPRAAHCTGCGVTFEKMHVMINHRRNHRCGGRFLPIGERALRNAAAWWNRKYETTESSFFYTQWRDLTRRANTLRIKRLHDERDAQAAKG